MGLWPSQSYKISPKKLQDSKVIGSDYNQASVDWCNQNIPEVEFLANDLHPPLKAEGNSFDVCYSISVFTHLSDEVCREWANEIFRVLKPGRVFMVTTNGESKLTNLFRDELKH